MPTGPRWSAREPWVERLFLAALLLAALLVCGRALLSADLVVGGHDLTHEFLALRAFGFGELRNGHLALWNPYVFSGTPNLGVFESALLYPLNAPFLFLPLGTAVNVVVLLHLFLAGVFTFFWCRRRGSSPPAAFLAGLVFMLSGAFLPHVYEGHLTNICAMVWAPLIFLSLDGWFQEGRVRWLLLGAGSVAFQVLAGHPQYAYYTGLAAAAYSAFSLVFLQKGRTRAALGAAAVYAGGAALAAVQLLAGWDAVSESVRAGGTPYAFASTFALPPENLITLLAPGVFGDAVSAVYVGRWYFWETSLFMGAAGTWLALAASVSPRGGTRRRWLLPGMVVLLLLLAFGRYTPLFRILYQGLPGFGSFRGAAKFDFLVVLFLAVLAADGFDGFKEGTSGTGAWAAAAAAVAASAAGAGLWLSTAPGLAAWGDWVCWVAASGQSYLSAAQAAAPGFVRDAAAFARHSLLVAAACSLAFAALAWARGRWKGAVYGFLVLSVLELALFARGVMEVSPWRTPYPERWKTLLESTPGDYRVLNPAQLYPNVGMTLGVSDLWGALPLVLKRYARFMAATQGKNPDFVDQYLPIQNIPPVFDMLRCRFVFDGTDRQAVYERARAMPRLSILDDWRVVPDERGLLEKVTSPGFDPRRLALLESEPGLAASPGTGASPAGEASMLRASTDELEIEADLTRPALLLVTDAYSRGWRIRPIETGPQTDYRVLPADYVLRAVPLSAGRHHFLMVYSPPAFRIGALISAAAWVAFTLLAFRLRGRRRPGPEPDGARYESGGILLQ